MVGRNQPSLQSPEPCLLIVRYLEEKDVVSREVENTLSVIPQNQKNKERTLGQRHQKYVAPGKVEVQEGRCTTGNEDLEMKLAPHDEQHSASRNMEAVRTPQNRVLQSLIQKDIPLSSPGQSKCTQTHTDLT